MSDETGGAKQVGEAAAALAAGLEVEPSPVPEEPRVPFEPHATLYPEDGCDGQMFFEDREGPIWIAKCDACGIEAGVPMLRRDPERLKAFRMERAGLPEMFVGKEFVSGDKDQEPVLAHCRAWLKSYRSIPLPAPALYGKVGRGKSHLLALMVETLIRVYGVAAVYRSAVGMFDELQRAMGTPRYDTVWERLCEVEVLALDDLAAERLTDWREDRFSALIDSRYTGKRPTLLGTNLPPEEWEDAFGDRAASRLRGMCRPLELKGPDRRYLGQQEQLGMEEAA